MKRCVWTCLVLTLGLVGTAFAPAAFAAPDGTFGPKITALIGAAKHEGRLQLSWSGAGYGRYVAKWIAGFNKFYGLKLPYSFTPAPPMSHQAEAIVQSALSHTPAASDVAILGSDNLLMDLKAKATYTYDWRALAKEIGVELPAKAVATDNVAIAYSSGVFGITYNKNAVPPDKVPHTLEAVLQPDLKGRIASTPYAAGFNYIATFSPQWTGAKMQAYVTKLSHQIGGFARCDEPGPLLSGQFDMLVLECDVANAVADEHRGVPIGYVIPSDAAVMQLWYMVVPKMAPDPAAGALLALFMVTKEGQALSWKTAGGDLALLPGSHTAALFAGMHATDVDIQKYAKHPEATKYAAQYAKILTGMAHK